MGRQVHLHPRDLKVLELLADRRVETLNVLHEKLWPGRLRKSAYNRLGQLTQAGYLTHVVRRDERGSKPRPAAQHLYLLGPKAPTALRIRDREAHAPARRRVRNGLDGAHIDHQLATNRVGDWLKTRLIPDAHLAAPAQRRQHRADAGYEAAPDEQGRTLVLVEVDLGHYSQARILAKTQGFLQNPDARSILFATPTADRADRIAEWVRNAYGPAIAKRFQVRSFGELRRGAPLVPGTEPAAPATEPSERWHHELMGPPGHD